MDGESRIPEGIERLFESAGIKLSNNDYSIDRDGKIYYSEDIIYEAVKRISERIKNEINISSSNIKIVRNLVNSVMKTAKKDTIKVQENRIFKLLSLPRSQNRTDLKENNREKNERRIEEINDILEIGYDNGKIITKEQIKELKEELEEIKKELPSEKYLYNPTKKSVMDNLTEKDKNNDEEIYIFGKAVDDKYKFYDVVKNGKKEELKIYYDEDFIKKFVLSLSKYLEKNRSNFTKKAIIDLENRIICMLELDKTNLKNLVNPKDVSDEITLEEYPTRKK